jgi:3-oxoacyl-[acyl-carrier-protein] synthase-1
LEERVIIAAAALRSALGSGKEMLAGALLGATGKAQTLSLDHFGGRDYLYYPMRDSPALESAGRLMPLLEGCVAEALRASALPAQVLQRAALFLGSSSFAIGDDEQQLKRDLRQGDDAPLFPYSFCGDPAQQLAQRFALRGGAYSFNTACTSSANALLYAQQAVRSGSVSAAVVVGVECFNYTTMYGFDSLQLLSREQYRPFDRQRSGLVLGEGIGALVVTSARLLSDAAEWGDVVLLGGDNGCDPNGMTCSSAESMAQVMEGALSAAGVDRGEIALIKAHATGSESNDAAEAHAMRLVFGDSPPDFTALKGALGHTLGASGVLELVALAASLRRGAIPPTAGFSQQDEALGVSPLMQCKAFRGGAVMCNYFGFGGNNSSLILALHS